MEGLLGAEDAGEVGRVAPDFREAPAVGAQHRARQDRHLVGPQPAQIIPGIQGFETHRDQGSGCGATNPAHKVMLYVQRPTSCKSVAGVGIDAQ